MSSSDSTSAMKLTGSSGTGPGTTSSSMRPSSSSSAASLEANMHHLKRASRPPNIMIQSHDALPNGDLTNGPYSAGPIVSTANGGPSSYSNGNSSSSTPIVTPVPLFPFNGYSYHATMPHPALHANALHPYYSLLARHSSVTANVSSSNSPIASIPQPPMSAPATMKELPKHWPLVSGFNQDLPYSYSAAAAAALSILHSQQQASQLSHSSSDDTLYPFHPMNPPASQAHNQMKQIESEIHQMNFKNKQQHLLQQQQQNYPQYYFKGSLIQLADGNLRRVEDMKTEDFISCVQSSDAKVESSRVLAIGSTENNNSVLVTFEVGRDKTPLTVESPFEHPFFVYEKGWSACCPERCKQVYDLDVRKLCVGDHCISLNSPQH